MTKVEQSVKDELVQLDKKHFIHPTSNMKQLQEDGPAFIFTEGDGIYLKDVEGRKLMDSLSSLWNVNIGHGRKEIGEVAKEQINKLAFTSTFNNWSHEPVIRLAAEIAEWAPGDLNATFFTSGGSEANDTAFKTVRHYWKVMGQPEKKKIISRKLSYHGVAMGATSATGIEQFHTFTTSIAPDFHYVDSSIEALKELIEKEGADTIAAYISEPVQGSGGVNLPPEGYFQEVRKICDEHDILFIADEVICGFGRLGTNFGIERFGVTPDIITMAKGVTSGYAPLGGMIISERIHQEIIEKTEGNFWHGYTYSGHPTAAAIALKNLEIIKNENLIEHVNVVGKQMLEGFEWIKEQHDNVVDVRGIGLLGAIGIERASESVDPIGPKVVAEALKKGLICRSVVYNGQDTLAFAPPFPITKEQMDEMIIIVNESIKAVK
ncbi:aspartate aminotransferase family protein [Pseudogracilibacillus auburnensis]|uniref:Adenosylmethionine-8-amino-7-oxononanoate aminotransferase n=1 Tax=Pseudogracilibacillus auburnensis TaxID=1494959 RepID=A0A2V3VZW3_9BACI|nr:aspartate aminotransferase family protein [Pseudogracilibacillus auburnensis]MBO1002988.1 aspartate aminotransferase family protein [Pseudogracilibacillus auburnensis]PXW87086.1 adenosylmethionine-8-amino-7-oxononanoate aminotransferase [Pseudogracilibacillus auburnensis]